MFFGWITPAELCPLTAECECFLRVEIVDAVWTHSCFPFATELAPANVGIEEASKDDMAVISLTALIKCYVEVGHIVGSRISTWPSWCL